MSLHKEAANCIKKTAIYGLKKIKIYRHLRKKKDGEFEITAKVGKLMNQNSIP